MIPSGRAAWVVALPLRHTFYVENGASWREAARGEIERFAAARELDPAEVLELLPPASQRLERLAIEVADEPPDSEGRRRSRDLAQRQRQARRLLAEIGTAFGATSRAGKGSRRASEPGAAGCRRPVDLVGRDRALATLESLLGGDERLSVAVIGRELVGKSALIETALGAREQVYVTSGARLLAGQSCFGQWQERAHRVMKAAELLDAVLYFDDLADLFAARGSSEDVAGLMRPYLERRRVRIVGELTPEAADRQALSHVGFFSQLHQLKLEPLDAAATRRVLEAGAERRRPAGPEGRPDVTAGAIAAAVELAERYLPYRAFPGKAVRLVDELLVTHAGDVDEGGERAPIGVAQVHEAVSLETGIPAFLLRDDRALKLEQVARAFGRRIVGQRPAVDRIAQTLCAVKARLQPAGRPLASLLFIGPTGVGKTEVARTLADFLFGSEERLLRFDMSEYMDRWAAERLIRGTDREDGLLTRRVRRQPFSVLLLDEIEKADGAVFDLLLQVMGEARLTDARGRTAYFHNTLLIMTSNLGAAHRRDRPGFRRGGGAATSQRYYQQQVEEHFRPELVNRLDRVIAFEALSNPEVRQIAGLAARRFGERHGLRDRGIELDVAPEVLDRLAREAYDPAYGARRLYRHLEQHLVAPLASLLARLGTEAEGSVLEVRPRPPDRPGRGPALEDSGPLSIACRRRADKPRAAARLFEEISGMRRNVGARMRTERLEELEERIEALATQLAAGRGRRRPGRSAGTLIAGMQKEHHRLSRIWRWLLAAGREVEDVEELAIHAVIGGEPVAPLLEPARAALGRWRAVLPHALVALETRRDEITLLLTECDRWRGLDLWLAPLLAAAPRRGWSIAGHLFSDPEAGPSRRRWGPLRSGVRLAELVAASDRDWHRVLLRVSGPDAGIFLATEAGIHRFQNPRHCDRGILHLEIERVAWRSSWTRDQLTAAGSLLEAMPPPVRVASSAPVRRYDFKTGRLALAGDAAQLSLSHEDYWRRFDEIVYAHLLLYEDHPHLDRDRDLLPVRLTELEDGRS